MRTESRSRVGDEVVRQLTCDDTWLGDWGLRAVEVAVVVETVRAAGSHFALLPADLAARATGAGHAGRPDGVVVQASGGSDVTAVGTSSAPLRRRYPWWPSERRRCRVNVSKTDSSPPGLFTL